MKRKTVFTTSVIVVAIFLIGGMYLYVKVLGPRQLYKPIMIRLIAGKEISLME